MGRRIPAATDNNHNLLLIHPLLYFSFLAATLAASIVIITALCGVRSRKKPSSPSPSDHPQTTNDLDAELPQTTNEANNQIDETQSNELPLPPAMQQFKESSRSTSKMKKSSSERRLSLSLSLKVPRSLSVAKNRDPKEDGRKKDKLKPEESVWMKTIILGEKCVPDEEENAVIYEGEGKKISAYHPRNSCSLSISKQMSSIDHQDIPPDPYTQKQQTNENDE